MELEHDKDENKQVSGDQLLEGENGDVEHRRIHSEETGSVIIHSETHSRDSSSSSSSSSSSYTSPPKDLPDDDKESLSNDPEVSPIVSPPVQVMDREDNNNGGDQGYDPNRIPSSVFERSKSNIPADWSCTSNESLFSIHLGRNSFTVDMMKSGELYRSGELLAYSPLFPMPPPPGGESNDAVFESKVVDSDKEDEDEVVVLVEETHKEENDKRDSSHDEKEQFPAVSWKTPSASYRSNRSSNSTQSFSFPILAGAASDSAAVETEDKKKQDKQSQETQQPAQVGKQKHSIMCRWFSCFPPCPWCCSSRSSCSCS